MAYRKDLDARGALVFFGGGLDGRLHRQPEAARSWWSCNRARGDNVKYWKKGNANPRPGLYLRLTLVVYIFLRPSLSGFFRSIV